MPFLYFSQLLRRPICTREGERVARIKDFVACVESTSADEMRPELYPPISGVVAGLHKRTVFVPWDQVARLDGDGLHLASARIDLQTFERREGEVLLARDVLDKQLIDVDGRRVITANDLLLFVHEGAARVTAVDVSGEALVRRLSFGKLFADTSTLQPPEAKQHPQPHRRRPGPIELIAWADVEPLAASAPGARLRVSHDRLRFLHPVDLAHIVGGLNYHQGTEIIQSLDTEMAADTLQEIGQERQADIVEGMDRARAAAILEDMAPDDAADLLADLEATHVRDLLQRMDRDGAEDVQELLRYPEESAGGIMTNEFLSLPGRVTVDESIAFLRQLDDVPDLIDYLFVVEEDAPAATWAEVAHQGGGRLLGIVPLRDLLLSPGERRLGDLMNTDVIWVAPGDTPERAAQLMSEYNLMALPVLDDEGRILGIITVDDVMEVVLPERHLRRLPRVFG